MDPYEKAASLGLDPEKLRDGSVALRNKYLKTLSGSDAMRNQSQIVFRAMEAGFAYGCLFAGLDNDDLRAIMAEVVG